MLTARPGPPSLGPMGTQVAFVVCVVMPLLLVAVPLLLAHRKDRKAKAARLGPRDDVRRS